ncbi:MAG: 4-hydroxy-tetrahydrodipicolinate synthase [Oscillospiraceae bacterium]|nr:4-hydroxy-tetrahydrodipicolinate synthase [Oscillospiraceae bacterium]
MKKVIFKGAGVAIVTPMNDDFSVNYDKLGEIIDNQIANGTDAIVIAGTTGEASTFTDQEHVDVIRYAVEKTAGRVPVVAGAGSNDTSYAIWLSKEAAAAGADALLHVTPYYNKTSQMGLIRHFNAIADATDVPVILYNVPTRTGVNIKPDTYFELSKHPNIVATKEANSDIAAMIRTKALCGDELGFYSGNDDWIVPSLAVGGLGVISVLSNVMPRETHDICELFFKGDVAASAKLQTELVGLIDALFIDVNPIPVKEAMNLMGMNVGPARMPLVELSDAHRAALKAQLEKAGLIK